LNKELARAYVYASMLSDEDTRQSGPQGMQQEMQQIAATFAAQASFIEPEIVKMGSAAIEKAIPAEPRLKPYAFYLRDIDYARDVDRYWYAADGASWRMENVAMPRALVRFGLQAARAGRTPRKRLARVSS